MDVRGHIARARHGHSRQPGRHDGTTRDPQGPAREPRGSRVDGERLHPHLRRPAPDRRRPGRPLRAPAAVRRRSRHLHARLGGGGARPDDGRARRGQGGPGCRRRDRDAAHPDYPLGCGPRRKTRRGTRRLGRDRRPRRRPRTARRGRGRLRPLVAVDLLDQRAGRSRADSDRPAAPRRDVRSLRQARPPGVGLVERRSARHRLGTRAWERSGLDEPRDRRSR